MKIPPKVKEAINKQCAKIKDSSLEIAASIGAEYGFTLCEPYLLAAFIAGSTMRMNGVVIEEFEIFKIKQGL